MLDKSLWLFLYQLHFSFSELLNSSSCSFSLTKETWPSIVPIRVPSISHTTFSFLNSKLELPWIYSLLHHFQCVFKFPSYPQSGAGHQRQSGSATSHLLSMNSSYLSMSARSPRIMRMSCGLKRSEHSGQLMLTRDSEISMRRYWRRQSMQERW